MPMLNDDPVEPGWPAPRHIQLGREALGRIVRQEWMRWAREQPNPKVTWLQPWEALTEPEREVDRRIGEAILSHVRIMDAATFDGVPVVCGLCDELGNCTKEPGCAASQKRGEEIQRHPLDALLPEICQLIDACKADWQRQGCWSEWDQSVRDRITAYNLSRATGVAPIDGSKT